MIKTKEVKYLDFSDFIWQLQNIFEIPFCNSGVWNAPKDKSSFNIIWPSKSDDSHVLAGEAQLMWQGYINEPYPLDRIPEFKPHEDNPLHKLVDLSDCLLALQKADLIKIDDFVIVHYSW